MHHTVSHYYSLLLLILCSCLTPSSFLRSSAFPKAIAYTKHHYTTLSRWQRQKQNSSAVKASKVTKATTKVSSSNLKKHNIQHLCLEISGLDSSTFPSTIIIDINDVIQTALLERLNKLRSPYADLTLGLKSHFDQANTRFDRLEDRLKSIDKRLDFILGTMDKTKETNKEIFASLRNISENQLVERAIVRGYEQTGSSRIHELSQESR